MKRRCARASALCLVAFALCFDALGRGGAFAEPGLPNAPPARARVVGGTFSYRAQPGDSLTAVGARFGIDVPLLARTNGLARNARLALGQTLRIDNPHLVPPLTADDAIVVNIPQRMLFQVRDGAVIGAYPVAAGRPSWRTPRGEFAIDERSTDKIWIVPRSIQEEMAREGVPVKAKVPPGPENPLGRHWLGLTDTSCGLHGTIAPSSIFSLRTHGCVRLHPDDIAAVYGRAALGDAVRLAYQPVLLAALADGRVCLEAHPDAYHIAPPAGEVLARLIAAESAADRLDPVLADAALQARAGIAIDVTRGAAEGTPCR